jgi:hypothetical protein
LLKGNYKLNNGFLSLYLAGGEPNITKRCAPLFRFESHIRGNSEYIDTAAAIASSNAASLHS